MLRHKTDASFSELLHQPFERHSLPPGNLISDMLELSDEKVPSNLDAEIHIGGRNIARENAQQRTEGNDLF
jgi:hypothetical protein